MLKTKFVGTLTDARINKTEDGVLINTSFLQMLNKIRVLTTFQSKKDMVLSNINRSESHEELIDLLEYEYQFAVMEKIMDKLFQEEKTED